MKNPVLVKFRKTEFYIILLLSLFICSCSTTSEKQTAEPVNENLWLSYSKDYTEFKLWSPEAENVRLNFYEKGNGGEILSQHNLKKGNQGIWKKKVDGDLNGKYYTFQIKMKGKWLDETPGIYAKAVGVNGKRAMVLDFGTTNPSGWKNDKGPELKLPNEAVIYEIHVRDFTIHPNAGSSYPGKFIGLSETGTKGPNGVATAIDHLKELGVTHVHLLPSFDHHFLNEEKLDSAQFNWGYDPKNYNVPEGSYSTDPYNAEVRIKEFKQMVKGLHNAGIGVILDVVYNHTALAEGSWFNLEYPKYYYRFNEDGSYSNASGCGNETASDKSMMRKYIIESVKYWIEEYHIDGFRFDLMAVHDIETMNILAKEVKKIDPRLFIYGEGWTGGDSPLPLENRALKAHIKQMPSISAFSDDIRDGIKGSVFDELSTGFVSGAENSEESIKFGIVGSIYHPQINYKAVNYSDTNWTNEPWQAVSYVSCHDNHTLYDKLKVSRKDASEKEILKMHKLANSIVLTSQGIGFIHAGVELLRTKNGEHNSYNLPDEINRVDWSRKTKYSDIFEYYKNLIALRRAHPAFRMATAEDVRKNLKFQKAEEGLISYQISNNANGDEWKNIYVVYNAKTTDISYELNGDWNIAVLGNKFDFEGRKKTESKITIPKLSMAVFFQK